MTRPRGPANVALADVVGGNFGLTFEHQGLRARAVIDEILSALEFAHGKRVIHRDLKPNNVLVRDADQQPIILDFGCAFFLDEIEPTMTTQILGTPGYIPPEVYENPKHRDARQDVYACGVMLYQAIMGQRPQRSRYQSVDEMFGEYVGVDAIIQAAIAPEDERTPTAAAMRERLSELLDQCDLTEFTRRQ